MKIRRIRRRITNHKLVFGPTLFIILLIIMNLRSMDLTINTKYFIGKSLSENQSINVEDIVNADEYVFVTYTFEDNTDEIYLAIYKVVKKFGIKFLELNSQHNSTKYIDDYTLTKNDKAESFYFMVVYGQYRDDRTNRMVVRFDTNTNNFEIQEDSSFLKVYLKRGSENVNSSLILE